jgi:hypothetical protein
MYHCQLHPPPPPILLTSPCIHHRHLPSASSPQALANTTSYQLSTVPYPPECRAFSSPFKRNISLNVGERDLTTVPAPVRCKTYTMPWQTCSACPHYPFHSLLLIDPPPLWQPYPKANHAVMSCASPLQSPQSLQHRNTHQNLRKHISNQTSGISRIQPIPSIDMVPRRPMNTGLIKQGRKPTIAQNVHC